MKRTILHDEIIGEKEALVIKARTLLISDDFGNARQRFSEIYFDYVGKDRIDSVGLTTTELYLVTDRYRQYLSKYNEI
jgi:hypothetical protein